MGFSNVRSQKLVVKITIHVSLITLPAFMLLGVVASLLRIHKS